MKQYILTTPTRITDSQVRAIKLIVAKDDADINSISEKFDKYIDINSISEKFYKYISNINMLKKELRNASTIHDINSIEIKWEMLKKDVISEVKKLHSITSYDELHSNKQIAEQITDFNEKFRNANKDFNQTWLNKSKKISRTEPELDYKTRNAINEAHKEKLREITGYYQ